jgi:hypothetical protein
MKLPLTALGLALLLAAASAAAADETRAQVEQRIRLAARLITDSPTAQRITASGNTQAVSHYETSRLHQSLAEDALQRGDLAEARKQVDEALRKVGQARRLVPDAMARQAAARQRHEQMLVQIERLIEAWRAHTGPQDYEDGDMTAALGLIGTARYFAEAGRYEEGVYVLGTAESHVLSGMKRVLHMRELNYTERAASPAEELQLELLRQASLADLLPLAVNELKPRADAQALIERYAQTSKALRAQALLQQQGGDIAAGLQQIRNATLYLQRALQAAGVALPMPTESPP